MILVFYRSNGDILLSKITVVTVRIGFEIILIDGMLIQMHA